MSIKKSNEVTVKILETKENFIKELLNKGFKENQEFSLDDYYYIPSDLDIDNLSTREILAKSIIIRYIVYKDEIFQTITFKRKDIAEDGSILKQESINCYIKDIAEAKTLFKALGYIEIMNIKEKDIIYFKEDFNIILKIIENEDLLLEIETKENTAWNTIPNIIKILRDLDLPIDNNNYFVKKAENMLNKLLNR